MHAVVLNCASCASVMLLADLMKGFGVSLICGLT